MSKHTVDLTAREPFAITFLKWLGLASTAFFAFLVTGAALIVIILTVIAPLTYGLPFWLWLALVVLIPFFLLCAWSTVTLIRLTFEVWSQ